MFSTGRELATPPYGAMAGEEIGSYLKIFIKKSRAAKCKRFELEAEAIALLVCCRG